jgi:hypothetical protein
MEMVHGRAFVFASALIMLSISNASAQIKINEVVAAGKTSQIDFLTSLNADCSIVGLPTIHGLTQPQFGTITVKIGLGNTNFLQNNQRYYCNTRKVKGLLLFYTPRRGFVGQDRAITDVIYASGRERITQYEIAVK